MDSTEGDICICEVLVSPIRLDSTKGIMCIYECEVLITRGKAGKNQGRSGKAVQYQEKYLYL
jgi:hypothetical protein